MSHPCTLCSGRYRTPGHLVVHVNASHPSMRICLQCLQCFDGDESLGLHSSRIHRPPHFCIICHQQFRTVNSLHSHARASCVNKSWVGCDHCGRRFPTKQKYQHHAEELHRVDRNSGWPCTKCDAVFSSQRAMTDHSNSSFHQQLVVLPCPAEKCGRTFGSPSALLAHLESGGCVSGIERPQINALALKLGMNCISTENIVKTILGAGAPSGSGRQELTLEDVWSSAQLKREEQVPGNLIDINEDFRPFWTAPNIANAPSVISPSISTTTSAGPKPPHCPKSTATQSAGSQQTAQGSSFWPSFGPAVATFESSRFRQARGPSGNVQPLGEPFSQSDAIYDLPRPSGSLQSGFGHTKHTEKPTRAPKSSTGQGAIYASGRVLITEYDSSDGE